MEKEIFGRLKLNINTPSYWESCEEAPLKGEMIIYEGDIPQIKIGDGVTLAKNLPFVTLTKEEIESLFFIKPQTLILSNIETDTFKVRHSFYANEYDSTYFSNNPVIIIPEDYKCSFSV